MLRIRIHQIYVFLALLDPDPDPLVTGMDPRIRIRIHTKMSWIRNTGNLFRVLFSTGSYIHRDFSTEVHYYYFTEELPVLVS